MSGQTNGARGRSQHIRLILHPTCVIEPAVDGCPLVAANSAHGVSLPHARKLARKNPIVNTLRRQKTALCPPAASRRLGPSSNTLAAPACQSKKGNWICRLANGNGRTKSRRPIISSVPSPKSLAVCYSRSSCALCSSRHFSSSRSRFFSGSSCAISPGRAQSLISEVNSGIEFASRCGPTRRRFESLLRAITVRHAVRIPTLTMKKMDATSTTIEGGALTNRSN